MTNSTWIGPAEQQSSKDRLQRLVRFRHSLCSKLTQSRISHATSKLFAYCQQYYLPLTLNTTDN